MKIEIIEIKHQNVFLDLPRLNILKVFKKYLEKFKDIWRPSCSPSKIMNRFQLLLYCAEQTKKL